MVLVILLEFQGQLLPLCRSWVVVVCVITVIAALEYSIRCPSRAVMSLVWLKFWLVGWLRFQNRNRLELFLASDWLVIENPA
jgi:hypothetical protein